MLRLGWEHDAANYRTVMLQKVPITRREFFQAAQTAAPVCLKMVMIHSALTVSYEADPVSTIYHYADY
jgi:hypothetical protein